MEFVGFIIVIGIIFIVLNANRRDTKDLRNQKQLETNRLTVHPYPARQTYHQHKARCSDSLVRSFFDGNDSANIIVLDIETNGLHSEYSVLSCSAIKYDVNLRDCTMIELGRFDRYYYPAEPFESKAIAINGLTKEEISRRRGSSIYSMLFANDRDFEKFCSNVHGFVCHNVDFEARFVRQMSKRRSFCTMKSNTNIVKTAFLEWKKEYKWPTLKETADYYGISVNADLLHNSMVDVEITAKIFQKMINK